MRRHRGICRTVYLVGPWAIKVPRMHLGPRTDGSRRTAGEALTERMWALSRAVQANLSENQWSSATGVAPVLHCWLGGLVNVYPRCEPWPDVVEPDYDKIGVGWLPRDRKPENLGLLDGEAVWVDYDGSWNGCPHSLNVAGLSLDDEE